MTGQPGADGTPFGRYRLVALLGRGGMGEVWRAYDTDTDRVVAIKLLPAHFSDDAEFKQRFRREAHAAAGLNTPHVVPIHHYGEIDGRLYVDMRLIEGRALDSVLADGPLEPSRAVRIIEGVALALQAAHKVGLLHRDVTPSNILVDENDFAYLIDFGIARAADETRLTKSGSAVGTFQYIAPERLDGSVEEDPRADIYSLACVLYECLTGHPPFDAGSMTGLVFAHLNTPPPQPSTAQPNVPGQMDPVIATGMAKDPDHRYATTVELANAARDAITAPIPITTSSPAPAPPTPQAPDPARAEPTVIEDESSTAAKYSTPPAARWHPAGGAGQPPLPPSWAPLQQPPRPTSWAPPQQPSQPAPVRRSRTPWIIAGVVAVVVVVAAAVGIPAMIGHRASQTVPTSETVPTSPAVPTSQTVPRRYAAQVVLPFTGLNFPVVVAVSSDSNIYVTDSENNRVLELAAGSTSQTTLPFTGLSFPGGVAANRGNIYVTDCQNNRVLELAAGSTSQTTLPFTGLNWPSSLTVDTAGNVYVADWTNSRVLELAAGSTIQATLPFVGLHNPTNVAVDGAGNIYVVDTGNNRVLKLAAGANTQSVLPFMGLKTAYANGATMAVDATGNVYVTDGGNNRILKLAQDSGTQTELPFKGLNRPIGVAVDAAGNVYVADTSNNRVLKLPVQ